MTATAVEPRTFHLTRPPQTDNELYDLILTLWGVKIPRTKVCPEHSTPFDALAEAYFARTPVSVWWGSRGFGGKSRTLAYLTLTEAVTFGLEANLLGGSLNQSQNILESMRDGWMSPLAPRHMVNSDQVHMLRLSNGAKVRTLTASQKSVRGPHPQRLRLDEIDEMDITILDGAMGQPMPKTRNGVYIDTQTVMSSTWQYPDKTMAEIMLRAKENGWPVHTWCYRETSNPIDGWLSPETIERKKRETSAEMFKIEYDLAEPSVGTRAFDTSSIEEMFTLDCPEPNAANGWVKMAFYRRGEYEMYEFEEPTAEGEYVTAADWAKEQDYTVISTFRVDCDPWRLVAYSKGNRKPWPLMVSWYNKRLARYGGRAIHDATGIGNVIRDYIDVRSQGFLMTGRQRDDMLSEYVAAVERGDMQAYKVESAYTAHKYASVEALYGRGKDTHLPDEICSFALAWHCAGRKVLKTVMPINVGRLNGDIGWADDEETEIAASPWREIGGSAIHAPVSSVYEADTGFHYTLG